VPNEAIGRECEGFRMQARDGRRDDLRGLWPAFENLQRRKSREWIRAVVRRALWGIEGCAWSGFWERMRSSRPAGEVARRARTISMLLGRSNQCRSSGIWQSKFRIRASAVAAGREPARKTGSFAA